MKNKTISRLLLLAALSTTIIPLSADDRSSQESRVRLSLDKGWKFALGNPVDVTRDFKHNTSYFSYLAKTGNGDGPAGPGFDDSSWQTVDIPHDWAVGLDFDSKGSASHGYKAIGRNFPQNNIGWYRRSFFVPKEDQGQRLGIEFDGIFRSARIWVNGHYLGENDSGYLGFQSNISEFLRYGGDNVIAVRVDATLEEGWFYEGAGIYRHTWLTRTSPLHVLVDHTLIQSEIKGIKAPAGNDRTWTAASAIINVETSILQESGETARYNLDFRVLDQNGKAIPGASAQLKDQVTIPFSPTACRVEITLAKPRLWDLENPVLHHLEISVISGGKTMDRLLVPFGIRQSAFDPGKGYFLNGRRVEIKGVNMHQDHAGVGTAIPDALEDFRIRTLQGFGANAIRCSHNPPSPALLDACDRLGILVMPENRLMGTGAGQMADLEKLIRRDRNHPSVIIWSIGNEEWGIEGGEKGYLIARTLQALAKSLDPGRPCTAGLSGGWDRGTGEALQVIGYNYIGHGSIDRHHANFPGQPGLGTEETTTQQTRGIWFDGTDGWLAPRLKGDSGGNIEFGWKFYAQRPFLAGLFWWTGFDYRGEPTPFGWPAISSQFGIVDTCGFPKDHYWYLKSWWTSETVLHINQHWNWAGKEGQEIPVTVNSNCDEVELFLNGTSLGRKPMEPNGHLEWPLSWVPGQLEARGYKAGVLVKTEKVATADAPATMVLDADRQGIHADGNDVSVITLRLEDAKGNFAPSADNLVKLELSDPGRIIGVGNGNPVSHEKDVLYDLVTPRSVELKSWRWRLADRDQAAADAQTIDLDTGKWKAARANADQGPLGQNQTGVFKITFNAGAEELAMDKVILRFGSIDENGWVYVNGNLAGESHDWSVSPAFDIRPFLVEGKNDIGVVVENFGGSGGLVKGAGISLAPDIKKADWERKAFNGLLQVIIQSSGTPGTLVLKARSEGMEDREVKVEAK